MLTTPEQQAAAAEAARKEDKTASNEEPPKPTPVPEPMAGSKTGLQSSNLNENKVTKVP